MTKKDYIKAANIINKRWNPPAGCFSGVIELYMMERAFVEFFKDDNPRFDVKRFIQACRKGSIEEKSLHPFDKPNHPFLKQ